MWPLPGPRKSCSSARPPGIVVKKAEVSRFMLAAFRSAARPQAPAPAAGGSSPGRTSITRSSTPGSAAARTHTVPVWTCTGKACPGWTRMKAGGAEDHLASKPCPLCKSPMEKSTREVPV
ncbi:cold-inducible protein YdjO-related protein [Paenibacillus rhizoplanae]